MQSAAPSTSRSRFVRLVVGSVGCFLLLSVAYLLTPWLIGGASEEERERIEAEWAQVVEAGGKGASAVGPGWEGSSLQRAAESVEAEGADGFFLAIGSGESCPIPEGTSGVLGMMGAVSPERVAGRSLTELAGVLTLARRWEVQAPSLVALLAAAEIGDRTMEAALRLEGGRDHLMAFGPPDPEDLYRAFCREQESLHVDFFQAIAPELQGETLELMQLGIKAAGIHEARRLRRLLDAGEVAGESETAAPGPFDVWRAQWLQRPEDLSRSIFQPMMSTQLESVASAWRDHLARWEALGQDR